LTRFALENTIFFPLTANPIGYHHFVMIEALLRQSSEIQKICLIPSNGLHPDPTKNSNIADFSLQLQLVKDSVQSIADPQESLLLEKVGDEKKSLQLAKVDFVILEKEFEEQRPYLLRDHIQWIQITKEKDSTTKILILIGSDLLMRMQNSQIFSNEDLDVLAKECHLYVVPRSGIAVDSAFDAIHKKRHVLLSGNEIRLKTLPPSLSLFLDLSSTLIRKSIQAKHSLHFFLPKKVVQHLLSLKDDAIATLQKKPEEWREACDQLSHKLDQQVEQLQNILDQRLEQKKSHTLALVETSTGGIIASALVSKSGISKHFIESQVLYGHSAKARVLGENQLCNTVSEEIAPKLAKAMYHLSEVDWVLAETGMAGPPDGKRLSLKNGICYYAIANSSGVISYSLTLNPFFTKKEHQLQFAIATIESLIDHLTKSKTDEAL